MSESGQSSSSFGSGIYSEGGSSQVEIEKEKKDGELDENVATFESGMFGVLYTVSKEKSPHWAFVAFRLFMDWIQVFLLVVNPVLGWDINPENKLWQAFSFISLDYFLDVRGYTFFLILLYIMAIALAANLGLCIWVSNSFKNNRFDHVWPIICLRYFSLVFYQILDVASLTLFLETMDCQFFSVDKPVQGFNRLFQDVYCWTPPHMIHVIVAAIAIVIFFVLATVFTMAEVELNPVSQNILATAHSKVEVLGFGLKMFMTCVTVFVNGTRWASTFLFIASFLLCYLYLKWLPHMNATINHIRVGSYFSIFWAALVLIIMSFQPGIDTNDDKAADVQRAGFTVAMWTGFVPMGFLGAYLSYIRTQYFSNHVVGKFRSAPPNTKSRRIYKFSDPREVEISSRCCRQWVDEDTLDPEAVALAQRIIEAGLGAMRQQPFMSILWSSFLIDVQGSYQSGYAELQNAKKIPNASMLERFCIFIREQEHTQKTSAVTSGEGANVDLVSYVEFQRNYRLAMRLHMDALIAKRVFWETLLHNKVTFDKLSSAVQRIEVTVKAAERMYRQVLTRHSNSVKILVLYVKFLQGVKNDPWSASRWGAEAEKLQRIEEENNERAVLGDGNEGMSNLDDKGVIIIGANCLIRMINEPAATLFGFPNRAELVGKNINLIVPPPFARNHNNYVRNYIQTGVAKILDQKRDFVGMHKDRYVIPINVFVTKVSGVGEDSVFMGIFKHVPPIANTATIWIMNGGLVLSCDSEFTDWLGYKQEDIHAKPIVDMLTPECRQELDDVLVSMRVHGKEPNRPFTPKDNGAANGIGGVWNVDVLKFKHMYTDDLYTFSASITMGGIGETALYVCKLTREEDLTRKLLTSDSKGRITHITSKLAAHLGSNSTKLTAGGMMHALDMLLPLPFQRLHHVWFKDKMDVPTAWSCRSGLSMYVTGTGPEGPTVLPLAMHFKRKEFVNKEPQNVVLFEDRTIEQMLDERRLSVTLNSQGMVTDVGDSPISLFGFDPKALVGAHIAYVIDVLMPTTSTTSSSVLADEDTATKILLFMAERSYDHPGMTWRVGVSPMMDPVALMALGPMGATMMAKRTVPAVMVVNAFMAAPHMEGAKVVLPSEMQLKVELWRSDLLSGVIELDAHGMVAIAGIKDQELFKPHLLTGVPPGLMAGTHMGNLLPLNGKPLLEALFTEGGLAPAKANGKGGMRGGLRAGGHLSRRRGVGPVHMVKIHHGTDGAELDLQVQAVVKQDIGVGCSIYVILHLMQPVCGRADFRSWVWSSPLPSLTAAPARRQSQRRASVDAARGFIPKDAVQAYNKAMKPDGPKVKTVTMMDHVDSPPANRLQHIKAPPEVPPPELMDEDLEHHPATPPDAKGTDGQTVMSRHPTGLLDDKMSRKDSRVMDSPSEMDLSEMEQEVNKNPAHLHRHDSDEDTEPLQNPSRKISKAKSSSLKGLKRKESKLKKKPEGSVKGKKMGKGGEDGDSVDSLNTGMNDGKRDRINTWMSHMGDDPDGDDPDDSDEDDEEDSDDEEEGDKQGAASEEDVDEEAEELDEAGNSMNDYKRGKRLKKLLKMLLSPQAQSANKRLKYVSIVAVIVLIIVDLAMFMSFYQLVERQVSQVNDLRSSSKAVNRMMQVALRASAIGIMMAGLGPKTVRHLGLEGLPETVDYLKADMEIRVSELETYHHGVYRGFNEIRQLPTSYNLRSIWEDALLPIRTYYTNKNTVYSTVANMSLWDAGNTVIKSARNILQNFETQYGVNTNRSMLFANDTDYLFIRYNAPRDIMNAYQQTLDGLMQQAIDDSEKVNNIQLIILAIEGGFIGFTVVFIMWMTTAKLLANRFAVYSVFMMVPGGIIKTLATKTVDIDDGEEEEDREGGGDDGGDGIEGGGGGGGGQQDAEAAEGGKAKGLAHQGSGRAKINFQAQNQAKVEAPTTILGRLLACVPSFLRPTETNPNQKRKLHGSNRSILWVTWPFMFWAVFVVLINTMGYTSLKQISTPIAVSNIVQFMSIRVNRVLMFSQGFASELYLDPALSYASAPIGSTVVNPKLRVSYRDTLNNDYEKLRIEYEAMLYGNKAGPVANSTDPHFELAKEGVMFAKGAELLYSTRRCFCQRPSDCQDPKSPFYRYTSNGLDAALKHFFYSVEQLILEADDNISLEHPGFVYIYEVGTADITGGLVDLVDTFSSFVKESYHTGLNLHIVAIVLCCVIGFLFLVFIMSPTCSMITSESKRVAELLSNLPVEVDVEAMVADALRYSTGAPGAPPPPAPGGPGAPAAKDGLLGRRRSMEGVNPVRRSMEGTNPGRRSIDNADGFKAVQSMKMV